MLLLSLTRIRRESYAPQKKKKISSAVYQVKIELLDIPYPAWRRVLVPGQMNLEVFIHLMIAVMGWKDCHMHCLHVGEKEYQAGAGGIDGIFAMFRGESKSLNASKYTLSKVLAKDEEAYLEYDFGDGWEHELIVEEIFEQIPEGMQVPSCISGEGACPPEDCGGIDGLMNLIDVMEHPENDPDEYKEFIDWLDGEKFEKEKFSSQETTNLMKLICR